MKPAISVIIPCFNDGLYLGETISKLKLQTFRDFEIIIVNDGSNDEFTLEVLKKIQQQEVVTVYHIPNQRMSAARNYGIERSNADLIVTLDADDYFDKTFFQKAFNILNQEDKIGVVSCYIRNFGLNKKVFKPRGGTIKNFLFSNQCSMCAMFRKSVWLEVGKFDEQMRLGYEDWEFFIRVTANGYLIKIIPEVLFYYRQTQKSTLKNDTIPNEKEIVHYIIQKHSNLYKKELAELIIKKQVLYTESRISWQNIKKMIVNRLTARYK
ncbi:MAG TPA: glycosyltransferase family A protein [Hanamia sp.]|nr:glycosyltransferase family A protein [Hanamia sp.]